MTIISIILATGLILFLVLILSFLRKPKVYTFKKEQFVPSDMDTVFDFFSRPENLEKITPPAMGFHIMTPKPVEMKEGAIIDYTVNIMGIPARWRTMITSYKINEFFVDEQLKGPYSYWHHKHSFEPVEGGINIVDEITYALPLEAFRSIVHPLFIKPQLKKIFSFRFQIIQDKFNNNK
ncbi:SRPBCC family protein [Candidatus Marinimicrobia bacterium]|jgi:ligand-binding SRPBCC domain-containing protein|nr:SRPBCC family protein [Candidatus Neomarinimicrobiota bacterium]MDA9841312.1 SRPBCC family protein [Candidatus Neomarinimicrobiota bacterium]MDB3979833.1 SRPBCC family protein [Candidatus Neomarinimicrobiota bacterium]MDC0521201.1 SRPBCC family protein [Candidatus Neomarinimicrobiota bacterium]MDC1145705.1 SRPBCC family protein [Candidatus Neomarinimicrobiota bacterium]|tara:strand:+ start:1653 stop:2189 length:537 start_codon:yes stop_codon:yes gene_type:complete